jgi:hypothetical protein
MKKHVGRIPTITENIAEPHMIEHSLHLGTRMRTDLAHLGAHSEGVINRLHKHAIPRHHR